VKISLLLVAKKRREEEWISLLPLDAITHSNSNALRTKLDLLGCVLLGCVLLASLSPHGQGGSWCPAWQAVRPAPYWSG
jgi:hypothetical protein